MLTVSSLIKVPIFSSIIIFSEMFPRIWGYLRPPTVERGVLHVAWSPGNSWALPVVTLGLLASRVPKALEKPASGTHGSWMR